MTTESQRGIFLELYKFDTHIDWSKFPMKNIVLGMAKKGELDRTGRKNWTNNSVNLRYAGSLPDKYDERIRLLFESIGGAAVVHEIIRLHAPEDAFVLLEVPAKSSPLVEDGYISHECLKSLVDLRIELHFWYV